MTIREAVARLSDYDDEDHLIFAAKPWTADSEAMIVVTPDDNSEPEDVKGTNLKYLLETFIAIEVIEDFESGLGREPSLEEKVARVIEYSINDA